jgi:signal transduction histidine kinase/DNA-binding response OmpR family regulator
MQEKTSRFAFFNIAFLLVCGAAVVLAMVVFILHAQKKSIFPSASERFDITEVRIASLEDACSGLSAHLSSRELANCTVNLENGLGDDRLKNLKLLTLDEQATNYHDKFQDFVAKQGLFEIREAILQKKILVVGFKVPRSYFVEGKFGDTPNVVVIAPSGDMRLCYLGDCPHTSLPGEIPALKFPLFGSSEISTPMVNVWMILRTKDTPFGLNLQYGLFVVHPKKMRQVERIHFSLTNGSELLAAILLLGITMMAILYALLWSDYLDFIAYAAFSASQFFACIAPVLLLIMTNWTYNDPLRNAYTLSAEFNVLSCGILFAWATLRPRASQFWFFFGLASVVLLIFAGLIAMNPMEDEQKRKILFALAFGSLLIPSGIAVGGGFLRWRMLKNRSKDLTAEVLADANRRLQEQLMMAGGLMICALPVVVRRLINLYGYWTYDLATLRSVAMFPLFAILLYTASSKFRTRAESYRKDLVNMTRQAAIGEMVQLLAHDVRKPFSLLRIGLDLMGKASTYDEMIGVMQKLSPQVSQSLSAVTGMLTDIMNVNSTPKLSVQPVSVVDMVLPILKDLKTRYHQMDVAFSFDLRHRHLLAIDVERMTRVFTNILENAIQSMGSRGNIWIYARDSESHVGLTEIVFGNSGSFINEEDRERVFDAFFTKGKKGGTGLGLAVARKFCELHGGSIRCFSERARGTEFILTLPQSDFPAIENLLILPKHSRDIVNDLEVSWDSQANPSDRDDPITRDLLKEIQSYLNHGNQVLKIMIVENEPLYAAALKKSLSLMIKDSRLLVEETADPDIALGRAIENSPHLMFIDIDLGFSDLDGFILCEKLREAGVGSYLCIHSNRSLSQDLQKALDSGADKFVPKPIRWQELSLLLGEVMRAQGMIGHIDDKPVDPVQTHNDRPIVVILDDDIFIREAWVNSLKSVDVVAFGDAQDFWGWFYQHPDRVAKIYAMILDLHLGVQDGLDVARGLREYFDLKSNEQFNIFPIFLCTEAHDFVDGRSLVFKVIPKDPLGFDDIRALIESVKQGEDGDLRPA